MTDEESEQFDREHRAIHTHQIHLALHAQISAHMEGVHRAMQAALATRELGENCCCPDCLIKTAFCMLTAVAFGMLANDEGRVQMAGDFKDLIDDMLATAQKEAVRAEGGGTA